jgi:hypothetical protein
VAEERMFINITNQAHVRRIPIDENEMHLLFQFETQFKGTIAPSICYDKLLSPFENKTDGMPSVWRHRHTKIIANSIVASWRGVNILCRYQRVLL